MLLGLAIFIGVEQTIVPRYSFAIAADDFIPFIPMTWGVYVLFFPFVVMAAGYAQAERFNIFKSAVLMAFIVSMGCFHFFPESVPRPDPALIDNAFLRLRFTRLWALDQSWNGMPSLHVTVTCLSCRMLWMGRYRWLVAGTGLLICLSTLTVKQHTLADVSGGMALALLCSVLAEKTRVRSTLYGRAE